MTGKFQEPLNMLIVCCNRGPAIRTGIEFLTTYEQDGLLLDLMLNGIQKSREALASVVQGYSRDA